MPVYNAEAYLKEAIGSVLSQTFTDIELLVIDDGSTDSSNAIIRSFNDPRIRIIENESNLGLISTLNIGLKAIDSKYIARTDADDVCMPKRLEQQVKFMENSPDVGACGTWFDSILDNGEIVPGGRFLTDFQQIRLRHLYQIQIIHGTSVLRNEILKKHGLEFNPEFKHAEDYDLFNRLGDVAQIANVPSVLYRIRHHGQRVSAKYRQLQDENSDRVRFRIFRDIGIEVEKTDLALFQELMHQHYAWFTPEKAEQLMLLLKRLIQSNDRTGYFQKQFLRKELSVRFLHLCNSLVGEHPETIELIRHFGMIRITDAPRLLISIRIRSMLGRPPTASNKPT